MTEAQKKKMRELDEAIEIAGGFVSAMKSDEIHYDYRAINEYCKKRGIEPADLTIREINNFIIQ